MKTSETLETVKTKPVKLLESMKSTKTVKTARNVKPAKKINTLEQKKRLKRVRQKEERPRRQTEINADWFREQFRRADLSYSKFADLIGVHRSAINLIFLGKRKMRLEEATLLAELLSVPLEDVLINSGVPISRSPDSNRSITVEGYVDGGLNVQWDAPNGPRQVPCPFPEKDIKVVRVQTTGSPYDGLDGALIYFRPSFKFSPDCVGRICVVRIVGETESRLRVIRRGYTSGHYNLTSLAGQILEEDVALESTAHVIWMKI